MYERNAVPVARLAARERSEQGTNENAARERSEQGTNENAARERSEQGTNENAARERGEQGTNENAASRSAVLLPRLECVCQTARRYTQRRQLGVRGRGARAGL